MLKPRSCWTTFLARSFHWLHKRRSRKLSSVPHVALTFSHLSLDVCSPRPSQLLRSQMLWTLALARSLRQQCLLRTRVLTERFPLREAIHAANNDPGTDTTVTFSSSLPVGSDGTRTITLTIANGELEVEGRSGRALSLTIDSSGLSPGITVKGDQTNSNPNNGDGIRLFNITDNSGGSTPPSVMMIGMTLTGADPAPGLSAPQGSAIRSEGLLKLTNMVDH